MRKKYTGKELKALRVSRGIRQSDLAKDMGCSRFTIIRKGSTNYLSQVSIHTSQSVLVIGDMMTTKKDNIVPLPLSLKSWVVAIEKEQKKADKIMGVFYEGYSKGLRDADINKAILWVSVALNIILTGLLWLKI